MNPAPLDRSEILSPEWLSAALSQRYPDTVVSGLAVVETIQTQATKIRFTVDFEHAAPGTPSAFCVKGILGPERERLLASGISRIEARFYSELAPSLTLRVPSLAYSGVDPATGHGLILMEDVIAAGGTFLTALTPYGLDQTAATLDQLARLHAESWNGRLLDVASWVPARLAMVAERPMLTTDVLQHLLDSARGDPLPSEIRSAERLHGGLKALVEGTAGTQPCLVHGDCHAGNLYQDGSGSGVVDWQMLQRGHWALDIAYHIGAVLDPETRADHERELLKTYLDRLASYGIEPPAWEEAWLQYRRHLLYGYYLWAVTRLVAPEITNAFVRRLGLAVAEHDSFSLVGC